MDYLKDRLEIKLPSNFQSVDPETEVKQVNSWWEIIKFAVIAFAIILPVRLYVMQPFIVSGESMIPTFHDGDYLVIDELSYRIHEPRRGDVIVFQPPNQRKGVYYIKRIVGLPGETIRIANGKIMIKSPDSEEEEELSEPYLQNISSDTLTTQVGPAEVFVLGDNRPRSSDSRAWGTLPIENITGKALVRLFPFRTIKFLPGAQQTYNTSTPITIATN